MPWSWLEFLSWLVGGVGALVATMQSFYASRQAKTAGLQAKQAQKDLHDSLEILEAETPHASLDEELGEVSTALTANVARLHDISERAKAFEDEVRALVEKAEVAKATAALHEEDAKKIATILGSESQLRLKEEIDRLSQAHAHQIQALKKSGNRTAWVTFVGGAFVGFLINILTSWMMS